VLVWLVQRARGPMLRGGRMAFLNFERVHPLAIGPLDGIEPSGRSCVQARPFLIGQRHSHVPTIRSTRPVRIGLIRRPRRFVPGCLS
jgi:hypothetical protein